MVRMFLYDERPELWEQIGDLSERIWPEYNLHGDVLNRYWGRLYEKFAEFQLVLCEDGADLVVAEGHTIPCAWDGTADRLPAGIDSVVEEGFAARDRHANTLCALAAEIVPEHRNRGLSIEVVRAMRRIAFEHGFRDLIAPVRPSLKERYPTTPIDRYALWKRDDGLPFDPWLRVHARLGGEILAVAGRSLKITGSLDEWEQWTGVQFPESGTYVFPAGLAPLDVDREANLGQYWEPNVWVRHRVG